MKELLVVDLGLVEYGAAWELQRRIVAARKAGAIADVLLFCEHPHVITLGRSGKISNLRAPDEMLRRMGVSFFETNRGGHYPFFIKGDGVQIGPLSYTPQTSSSQTRSNIELASQTA